MNRPRIKEIISILKNVYKKGVPFECSEHGENYCSVIGYSTELSPLGKGVWVNKSEIEIIETKERYDYVSIPKIFNYITLSAYLDINIDTGFNIFVGCSFYFENNLRQEEMTALHVAKLLKHYLRNRRMPEVHSIPDPAPDRDL